jgi:hypothetical protein
MAVAPRSLLLAVLGLCACGPQIALDPDGGSTGASEGGTTPWESSTSVGPPPATTGVTTGMGPTTAPPPDTAESVGDAEESDSADGGSFIIHGDFGCLGQPPPGTALHCSLECDPFLQDCQDGEKCMPWANDGGHSWNAFRCSPVVDDPAQAGEPCVAEGGGTSGVDDCDLGLMCFWVDTGTNAGTCVPLCAGSPENPICPGDSWCALSSGSALAVCLDTCDPLADECAQGRCLPSNDAFACHGIDPGDTPVGDACDFPQECSAGSTCVEQSITGDCLGSTGCCTSYCDLTGPTPDAACLPGQVCTPWWTPGEAPEPWAHVGVCTLPR